MTNPAGVAEGSGCGNPLSPLAGLLEELTDYPEKTILFSSAFSLAHSRCCGIIFSVMEPESPLAVRVMNLLLME